MVTVAVRIADRIRSVLLCNVYPHTLNRRKGIIQYYACQTHSAKTSLSYTVVELVPSSMSNTTKSFKNALHADMYNCDVSESLLSASDMLHLFTPEYPGANITWPAAWFATWTFSACLLASPDRTNFEEIKCSSVWHAVLASPPEAAIKHAWRFRAIM